MAEPILTQVLAVSHHRDEHGREALKYSPYRPGALGMAGPAPNVMLRPIPKWQVIRGFINQVRMNVEDLVRRALFDSDRGDNQMDAAARRLARHVFPNSGFVSLMVPGVHPQIDTMYDLASEIPWEVLAEDYVFCSQCR
ncbi:MAG: hypothetical protein ACYS8K_04030, partial [Planctomycetota bacterium]